MRLLGTRNWIADHSVAAGAERHWQLDDNIDGFRRFTRGLRVPILAGYALAVCEDFTDRYENIGVSGLNYQMFVHEQKHPPALHLNVHVYSCSLIWNRMPYRWREVYNDDTDLCLQVLAGGLCTVLLNAVVANKLRTMKVPGGNTADLYGGDGRARMSRALERRWPYVVSTARRYGRPAHVIRGAWRGFDTPLIRRTDIDWENLPAVDEYGMRLVQVADQIVSPAVARLYEDYRGGATGGA
jgi:hypothetical protein